MIIKTSAKELLEAKKKEFNIIQGERRRFHIYVDDKLYKSFTTKQNRQHHIYSFTFQYDILRLGRKIEYVDI